MEESIRKADILVEAIPYIRAFRGKVVVAKYGGSAIDNPTAIRGILQDLVFLSSVGIRAVLVHGGGPEISRTLSKAGTHSQFINGMRVTDKNTLRVINDALEGINHRLVAQIRRLGGHAHGIMARHQAIVARPHENASELGFVGRVKRVQTTSIRSVFMRDAVPVVSPIGKEGRQLYNINADDVASEVAAALKAAKLVLLTNVRGILRHLQDKDSLISHLSIKEARVLEERGVIEGGMRPKVRACIAALSHGVKKTHIIDAAMPHAMLLEIFTKQGIGTEIVR